MTELAFGVAAWVTKHGKTDVTDIIDLALIAAVICTPIACLLWS
jgi:hypothetical protein